MLKTLDENKPIATITLPRPSPAPLSPTLPLSTQPKRQRWLSRLLPIAFFSSMTAFFTYPLIFNFTTQVPGILIADRLQNLWNFWWINQAVTSFHNPYLTNLLFFPYHSAPNSPLLLYFHDLQLFNGVVTLPLQWIFGLAAAYNGVVFLATFISGLATYWLIRSWKGSYLAAALGGCIYAFAPIRMQAIQQSITNIQSTEFLPLFALFLHLAQPYKPGADSPLGSGWRKSMVVGAVLTLTFCIYTDWYNTVYLLTYAGFYLIWRIFSQPFNLKHYWHEVALLLLVGASALVLSLPLLGPALANLNDPEFELELGFAREVAGSDSLQALILPGAIKTFGAIGWILAVLACFSLLLKSPRQGWLSKATGFYWLMLTLLASVLMLGPELKISGTLDTHIPLPYALVRLIPGISVTKVPGRFVILAMLGMAVLAGFSFDWLKAKVVRLVALLPSHPNLLYRQRIVGGLLLVLVLGSLVLETWTPMPLFDDKTSAYTFLESLNQSVDTSNFNLLEMPITRHYNKDFVRMFNQTAHNKPILGGYLSRAVTDPYRSPNSIFNSITDLNLPQKLPLASDIKPTYTVADDFDTLARLYNFRYILVYLKEYDNLAQATALTDLLTQHYGSQQEVYADDELAVYHVPDSYFDSAVPTRLDFGSGWYTTEKNKEPTNNIWRWTNAASKLYATTSTAGTAQLQLNVRAFAQNRLLKIQLNGQNLLETKVEPGAVQQINVTVNLVAGRNEIDLVSLSGDSSGQELDPKSADTRRLAFAFYSIKIT
jgi:hypothetical protein